MANRRRYTTYQDVKDAIREYYGSHYKPDGAFGKISNHKDIGTVQKYLNNIDTLDIYTKMTDHSVINII